jgi:hypothetical protein
MTGDADDEKGEGEQEGGEEVDPSPTLLVWSDFLQVRLSESSFCEVPLWDVRNGTFSAYSAGDMSHPSECALPLDWREDAFDRLRLSLEDCDSAQGFVFTVDSSGGFGGLGASLAAEAREQCRSAALHATLLVAPPSTLPTDLPNADDGLFGCGARRESRLLLDQALTLHGLLEHASTLLPLAAQAAGEDQRGGEMAGVLSASSSDSSAARGELSDMLLAASGRLGLCLDSATLPFRRGPSPSLPAWRSAVGMRDWASALSPRADLRVLACAALSHPSPEGVGVAGGVRPAPLVLSPFPPGVSLERPSHWSRMLVGRGFAAERWADERAVCFAFSSPVALPRSFPGAACRWPPAPLPHGGEEGERSPSTSVNMCVSLGCNESVQPWLSSLAAPLVARSQAAAAARQASSVSGEDAAALAELLTGLAESYS